MCSLRSITEAVEVTLLAPSELCNMATKLTEGQANPSERRQWGALLAELVEHVAHSTLGELDLEATDPTHNNHALSSS